MKKENKKMAQERRAAERKKQATMRLVRNTLIIALIVAFFVGMIVYGVIDSRKQKAPRQRMPSSRRQIRPARSPPHRILQIRRKRHC